MPDSNPMDSIYVTREDAIATVVLNNPEHRNALNLAMWIRLGELMQELNADDTLRCIVLRGAGGRAFAAGADIAEFEKLRFSAEQAEAYGEQMHPAFEAIEHSPHPTVALIEGACVGGGLELALKCDLRISNRSGKLGCPINRLGHVLPWVGMLPLVQLCGRAVALEILVEGRILTAEEAYVKGLVNRVIDDEAVEAEAYGTAKRIANGAPLAARWHKQLSLRALDPRPLSAEEAREPYRSCDTEDYKAGVRAFLAKEKPVFSGR